MKKSYSSVLILAGLLFMVFGLSVQAEWTTYTESKKSARWTPVYDKTKDVEDRDVFLDWVDEGSAAYIASEQREEPHDEAAVKKVNTLVKKVQSGDGYFLVEYDGAEIKVMLKGIDTPEVVKRHICCRFDADYENMTEAYKDLHVKAGAVVKEYVEYILLNRMVYMSDPVVKDRWGRFIVDLEVQSYKTGYSLRDLLISVGYGKEWHNQFKVGSRRPVWSVDDLNAIIDNAKQNIRSIAPPETNTQ